MRAYREPVFKETHGCLFSMKTRVFCSLYISIRNVFYSRFYSGTRSTHARDKMVGLYRLYGLYIRCELLKR